MFTHSRAATCSNIYFIQIHGNDFNIITTLWDVSLGWTQYFTFNFIKITYSSPVSEVQQRIFVHINFFIAFITSSIEWVFFLLFIEMSWINCNCYYFIKSCEDMEFMPMLIKKSAWIRRRFLQAGTFCRVRKKEEQEEKQVKESLPRAESQCSLPSSFTRSGEPHEPKSEDPEAEARKDVSFSFRFFVLIFCACWGAVTSSLLPDSDEGVGGEADPLRQQLQQSHPVVQTEGADKTHTFKHTHEQTLSHTYTQQCSKI